MSKKRKRNSLILEKLIGINNMILLANNDFVTYLKCYELCKDNKEEAKRLANESINRLHSKKLVIIL